MTGAGSFLRRLVRRPAAVAASLWLTAVTVAALAPTVVSRHDPAEQDLASSLAGPSLAHPLGTDRLGQDLLSRLAHGAAPTLVGVGTAVCVSVVLGVTFGLIAGYARGAADALVMRVSDLLLAVPSTIILLVVLAVFPANVPVAMAALGVLLAAGVVRVVRAATRSVRTQTYVAAARVAGLTGTAILRRHVLPRLAGLVIVQASLIASLALVLQAGLAFLGFGPPPPQPTWGGMIADARQVMTQSAWTLVPPGAAVALTVLAFTLLGDAIRDTSARAWAASKLVREPRRPRVAVTPAAPPGEPGPEPPTAPLLAARDLTVAIPATAGSADSPLTVVSDVTLTVGPGEIVGLIGESGCGKSVTALALLGLPPGGGRVTRGDWHFAGHDLARASRTDWRRVRGRGIGYVAQDPLGGLDPTTLAGSQLIEAVRRHHRVGRREARRRAVDLLRDVAIPEPARVMRLHPHQMSGGTAQRVAIAVALAGSPRLLVADEPTTALDVTVQAELLGTLRRLSRDRGMAVLIVTHNLGVAATLCHRVVVMYAGQVVEAGPAGDLLHHPRHPYTSALLASDPQRAAGGRRLPAIAGSVPPPTKWPTGCRFADRCSQSLPDCRRAPVPLHQVGSAHVTRCLRRPGPVPEVQR
ncbi:dipeptide/oligopeptide/nickel ABC transporter permease/ATP-binding protein [Micromonospora chersina]|uniref:dipeptide/oligopeptide/nickel ABC transporter permease/ATP-binding protein n=1 Tax=Micromonospora chersina TaxID=47854 RepID=UPI0033CEA4BF